VGCHGYDCDSVIFPLVPRGYTGKASDDSPFQLQDFNLYVQGHRLDMLMASNADIDATTSRSYNLTTQKNENHNEKMVQGSSSDALCCPIKATICRVRCHRAHVVKETKPIAPYHCGTHRGRLAVCYHGELHQDGHQRHGDQRPFSPRRWLH
jgi:hypothetical protein